MIFGIGIDSVEIERLKKIIEKPNLTRLFSEDEIDFARKKGNPLQSFAGFFCSKEAVLKALGIGFLGTNWRDVEVTHDEKGCPFVVLHGKAKNYAHQKEIKQIHISISHDMTKAYAMAVAEKKD